jgi:hypothetical protein
MDICTTDPRPHIVIINRWREHYADYARYLDHSRNRVTYITTEVGLDSVPDTAVEAAVVPATDDLPIVRSEMSALVARHGPPAGIVGLKEDDLLVAAALREEWDCPGQRTDELIRFRDKYVMAGMIAAAGLPVPAFALAPNRQAVLDFTEKHGWPVVVKPRVGSSSDGVSMLAGRADLARARLDQTPMLVQECNPHQIYHVDGVYSGQDLLRWRASRYLNTCLGFRSGSFLGSVEEDDPTVLDQIGVQTAEFLGALTDRPVAFHLEIFVDRSDPKQPRCTFLEIGARVGGAEIPFIWRELHDFDLMEAAFGIQLGQSAQDLRPTPDDVADNGSHRREIGGWLLIPAPATRPCRIIEATPMAGRHPGPYAEALLRPGDVLPSAEAYYEHVGGRFRFRGGSSEQVQQAIELTAADFRVRAQPMAQVAVC